MVFLQDVLVFGMIPVGKGLWLCQVSLKTLFIYTNMRKRGWYRSFYIPLDAGNAEQHSINRPDQNTAHCADPIHGKSIQHFGLWALAGFSQKKTTPFIVFTVKQKVLMRTCCCTFQIKAGTGRWCGGCCWVGSACRPSSSTISWMSFSVAQGHAQHDAVLRAKLSVERSTAQPCACWG